MQKHFQIQAGLATFIGAAITIALLVNADLKSWIAAHGGWWWLVGAFVLYVIVWALVAWRWESPQKHLEIDASQPPSEYDQRLFEEVLRLFPLDEGTMGWLETFVGSSWKNKQADAIFDFEARYEKKYFDNQHVNEALTRLRDACGLLASWFVDEAGEEVPLSDGDYLNRVKTAKVRRGTQEDYAAAVRKGDRLGHDVVRARVDVEKVGRREGLRPPR